MTREEAALKIKERYPYPKGEALDVLIDMALKEMENDK